MGAKVVKKTQFAKENVKIISFQKKNIYKYILFAWSDAVKILARCLPI